MDETIKKLIEARARAWEQYKAFLDSVDEEKRDMSGEEVAKDEKYRADLDSLDARITELTHVRDANKRYAEIAGQINGRDVDPVAPEGKDALQAFFRGEIRKLVIPIGDVRVNRDAEGRLQVRETRALSSASDATGGYLIPTGFRRQLVEFMTDDAAIRKTGVTIIPTPNGEPFTIPKVLAHGTAAIVGEGTAIGGTDPSFSQATFVAWKYAQLCQVPRELISDSGVALQDFVARDLGFAIGEASGAHYVGGTGTTQPEGVMTVAGTGVTGGTGYVGVPTADNLIDLEYSLAEKYAARGVWFMRRATEGKIRKLKNAYDQYIWQPSLQIGTPNMLDGHPIVTDPNVAATGLNALSVAFGDFAGYWIRDVDTIELATSADFAFDKDLLTYRAILRSDGHLVDLNSIKLFKGGTA